MYAQISDFFNNAFSIINVGFGKATVPNIAILKCLKNEKNVSQRKSSRCFINRTLKGI